MCIFCKIVNNEVSSNKIYEDDDVIAILDIAQLTYGHTLVLPKKHYKNILDTPQDILCKMSIVTQNITKHYQKVLNIEDFNIINNSGELAGQTVSHFHIHILPRSVDSEFKYVYKKNDFDLNEIVKKLTIK